ncbi:hypothetical protein D1007_12943 [Hordeum vulgare]|nr:hypothetical protein D1007_12943 [Hordeum vulgare]
MERCGDYPCITPVKRLSLKEDKNGNFGHDFVKCESKPEGQIVKICTHFIWLDDYVPRLQVEGLIQFNGAATPKLNLPSAVRNLVSESAALTLGDAYMLGELKNKQKNLNKRIQLKKQVDLIALGFYFCIVALGFAYLLVITR